MSLLDSLKKITTVVADTGDFALLKQYSPQDSTTNPSLIFKAAQIPKYAGLVDEAVAHAKKFKDLDAAGRLEKAMDKVYVNFGVEILKIIPGRVSTEIDARLSFDTEGTIKKGKELIALYKAAGIHSDRILLKIASTWEGIRAAELLEKEGIHCNLTLLFSLIQAVGCAQAKVTLISPFVGRILDWHKRDTGKTEFEVDPGVVSVHEIYNYFKKFGYGDTVVMGASFRNLGEILSLAGVDYLTIAPKFLKVLQDKKGDVEQILSVEKAQKTESTKFETLTEKQFRWLLNEDACGTEKLAEGIRKFTADIIRLEALLTEKLSA